MYKVPSPDHRPSARPSKVHGKSYVDVVLSLKHVASVTLSCHSFPPRFFPSTLITESNVQLIRSFLSSKPHTESLEAIAQLTSLLRTIVKRSVTPGDTRSLSLNSRVPQQIMPSYTQLPRTPRMQSIPLPPVDDDHLDQELLRYALQDPSPSLSSESLVLSPYTPPKPSPLALDHVYGQFQTMSIAADSQGSGPYSVHSHRHVASSSSSRNAGRRLG